MRILTGDEGILIAEKGWDVARSEDIPREKSKEVLAEVLRKREDYMLLAPETSKLEVHTGLLSGGEIVARNIAINRYGCKLEFSIPTELGGRKIELRTGELFRKSVPVEASLGPEATSVEFIDANNPWSSRFVLDWSQGGYSLPEFMGIPRAFGARRADALWGQIIHKVGRGYMGKDRAGSRELEGSWRVFLHSSRHFYQVGKKKTASKDTSVEVRVGEIWGGEGKYLFDVNFDFARPPVEVARALDIIPAWGYVFANGAPVFQNEKGTYADGAFKRVAKNYRFTLEKGNAHLIPRVIERMFEANASIRPRNIPG